MPKRVLTDEDINLLGQLFATKEEVRDIVKQEIKENIGNLPTKQEFAVRMDQLAGEYQNFSTESNTLPKKISDLEERVDKIENHLDLAAI